MRTISQAKSVESGEETFVESLVNGAINVCSRICLLKRRIDNVLGIVLKLAQDTPHFAGDSTGRCSSLEYSNNERREVLFTPE